MVDPTETELSAILYAGNCGGQYLDELRIYDLSRLTQGQYQTFIRVVISAYLGEISRMAATPTKDGIPF